MTKLEMKENLKVKCDEAWDDYQLYKRAFGEHHEMTQRALGKWVGYDELYRELYVEYYNNPNGTSGRKEQRNEKI